MPDKEGSDDEKSTKSVVNKKQKQMMGEEGYDIARDMGKVRPSKDKKDATTMPVSDEVKKTQKVVKGPSAFERVKAKYGKSVMNVGKKKVKEELDLTQVAEAFGGYIIEISDEMRQRAAMKALKKRDEARRSGDKEELRKRQRQVQKFTNAAVDDYKYKQQGIEDLERMSRKSQSAFAGEPKDQSALRQVIGTARRARPDLFGNPDATPPSEKPPTIQDLMRQQGVNTDSKSDPTSRYDYDQLTGKEKEEYMNIKKEVEASKNQKRGFAGDTPPSKEKIKPVKQRKFTTGSGADAKDRGDKVTYGQPDEVKPKQGKLSKLATAAAANPAAALVAYDLGKGIIGKISKLRAPAVVGGKAGFRSAGGYQAT